MIGLPFPLDIAVVSMLSEERKERTMKLGDMVTWTSQASGFTTTKIGKIVAVVPAGVSPKDLVLPVGTKLDGCGSVRNHESYLIQVRKLSTLYWPLVKNLHLYPDGGSVSQSELLNAPIINHPTSGVHTNAANNG